MAETRRDINQFFAAGINYKKTDAQLRGQYAISNDKYAALLEEAAHKGLEELFVISTCNRTEIYGFAPSPEILMEILCNQAEGSLSTFREIAYVFRGSEFLDIVFYLCWVIVS